MNDQNRIDELLKSALDHRRTPSFLSIRERVLEADRESAPGKRGRAVILKRLALSCCALVLMASGLGIWGAFAGSRVSEADVYYSSMLSPSALRGGEGWENSRSYSNESASNSGAILYNVLPSEKLTAGAAAQNDTGSGEAAASQDPSQSLILQKRNWIGPGLLRAIEQNPSGVYDVVADIENADPDSQAVNDLQTRFLLYLDTTNYYLQMDMQQVEDYAQSDIKLMLVGQGPPVRPLGYPEAFDVGCAWIYNNSPEGTMLSVLLSTPLPPAAELEDYTTEDAAAYLEQVLIPIGLKAPDSADHIDIEMTDGAAYATYTACLDQRSALAAADSGYVTQIEAIPSARSRNPQEREYYYMVYGDGWVFSN